MGVIDYFKESKPAALDAPETTVFHRNLILSKPFLRKIYEDWYREIIALTQDVPSGEILEIGAGGGFLKNMLPTITTSDIIPLPHCDLCCPGDALPFADASLSALVMVDVLHHIPNVRDFFSEASRCLKPNGKVIMIEPANTAFSRLIYKNLHHEDFLPEAADWHFDSIGALSGANGALPWLVFNRDIKQFETQFPALQLHTIRLHTPFRYLISGGLSYRFPIPGFVHGLVKGIEKLVSPLNGQLAMFQTIQLKKH